MSFSGASAVLQNGSLWAVRGIEQGGLAAMQWFELDPATNIVLDSGVISDPELAPYYPSIAVNELDQAVIGISGSRETIFVSAYAVAGERVGGAMTFRDPVLLQAGRSDYEQLDLSGRNRWSDYSATVVDPSNPLAFWTFQSFVADTDVYGIQIARRSSASQRLRPSARGGARCEIRTHPRHSDRARRRAMAGRRTALRVEARAAR